MIGYLLVPYISRSGSTLLLNYLSQHQDFCVCLEADVLVKHFLQQPYTKNINPGTQKKYVEFLAHNDAKLSNWGLKSSDIEIIASQANHLEIFLSFLNQYQKRYCADAKIVVFKAAEIVDILEKLKTADLQHYSIRYLTLFRDPRACFASQLTTIDPYSNREMNKNPLITAYTWNKLAEKSRHFKENNPESYLELRYEDFILNPHKILNEIAKSFATTICDLKSPKSSWLFNKIPAEQKIIHHRVNFNPDPNRANAWKSKLKKTMVAIVQIETKGYRKHLGYTDESKANTLWYIVKKYYYKFRIYFEIDQY